MGSRHDSLVAAGRFTVEFASTRLLFGEGVLDRLGEVVAALGTRRVLLVTDPGLRAAGHVDRAAGFLAAHDVEVERFEEVRANPSESLVARGAEQARGARVDGFVALGGGSALDCAKGINFVLTNGGRMRDYRGYGKSTRPLLPAVGIPTTAGTGSDAQSYALVSEDGSGAKMACGTPDAKFRAVLLDPTLLATTPRHVLAVAAIDAASHAIESYVSTRRNPISQIFARDAWQRIAAHMQTVLETAGQPESVPARGELLLASFLAGAAIEHSMLGAAHACANPLTARHGVEHGVAVGLMLPAVMRFNQLEAAALYTELDPDLQGRFRALSRAAGLPRGLRECGIPEDGLDALAREAAEQWTVGFNPRPVTEADLRELYATVY